MVFTREKKGSSNKNHERCFFAFEKKKYVQSKATEVCEVGPKFAPFIGASSLQHPASQTFNEKSVSRKQNEKHLGKCSGIVSFVSLSMKKTAESRQNDCGKGEKQDET